MEIDNIPTKLLLASGLKFWIWEPGSSKTVFLSPGFTSILVQIGISISSFSTNPQPHLTLESFHDLTRAKSGSEIELRFRENTSQLYKLEITLFEQKDKTLACGTLRDITIQRRTELSFAQLFERYESILQASLNGYLLFNLDGFVVNCNQAFCNIIEFPELGIYNTHLSDLVSFSSMSIEEYIESIKNLESASDDAHIKLRNGNDKHVEISAHLIHLHDKDLIATFVRDTSDVHLTRAKLLDAMRKNEELSELKSALLNNVTHEFKSPLHRIIGLCDVFEKDVLDISNQQFILEIKSSSERLLNSLTAMMEISKIDSLRHKQDFSPISVEHVVEEIIEMYVARAKAKGLLLSFQCPENIPSIAGDSFLLKQSLKIILGNAIKFTHEGNIEMKVFEANDHVNIQISDTGIGMESEFLTQIFSPFTQESTGLDRLHEGLGLGLSLVKRYVEIMDGKIEIKSTKDVGTTAQLILPISNSNQP